MPPQRSRQFFVSEKADLITFVVTRNTRLLERKILNSVKDVPRENYYFGYCFGKYDYVFEMVFDSVEGGYRFLDQFRQELLKKSLIGSFSTLACFRIRDSKTELTLNPLLPFRTYTILRIVNANLNDLFKLIAKIKEEVRDTYIELLWNPSVYSFVAKISTRSFRTLADFLYKLRTESSFLRDVCSFVTIDFNSKKVVEEVKLRASINIKIGDPVIIEKLLALKRTRIRMGYYDIIKETDSNSLWNVLKTTKRIRKLITDPRSYTATILGFRKSDLE